MTSRYLRILAVSGGLFVTAAPAFGVSTDAPPALIQAQAAGTTATTATVEPGLLTQPVTDDAAVLSADERSEIESAIQQVSQTKGKSVRVVFLRSFGQYTPPEWVDKAVAARTPPCWRSLRTSAYTTSAAARSGRSPRSTA